jgi:competence protein ComEA
VKTAEPRLAWSSGHRKLLITLLVVLLAYAIVLYALNPEYVSDPQTETPARFAELADGIDPNVADAPTLAALPVIGPRRAQAIVEYRETFLQDHPGGVAFEQLEDLTRVKGIGPATIEQVRPYLIFPKQDAAAAHEQP